MPAFSKVWEWDVVLVYCWDDDDSVEYRVTYPGPITEAMTKDADAIPWGVMRGDRTFVFKAEEYRGSEKEASKEWLMNFCAENGLGYHDLIAWALDPDDDYLHVGPNESGGWALMDQKQEVFRHIATVTGQPIQNPDDKSYSCSC